MWLDKLVDYFLPSAIRDNKTDPRYDEFRVLVSCAVFSIPVVALFPLALLYMGKPFAGYYGNLALIICMLCSIKFLAHYRIPMTVLAIVTYFIIYDFIRDTGLIYSGHVGVLHVYLLAAIWVDKKWGWLTIFSNLLIIGFIFQQTSVRGVTVAVAPVLGSPVYIMALHCFVTVFLGGFLAFEQFDQERNRRKIRSLQDQRISLLDEAVRQRTEQLNNMRQAMAADFHDETGNMLSAITRQASLLQMRLGKNDELFPVVDSIIKNSNELYARSKDFLWNLNHDSDDPMELFHYLTSHGQTFYNQFDIAFSSLVKSTIPPLLQLGNFAALNLVFIFKEAMTNVVRHSGATEVIAEIDYENGKVIYSLYDNGNWKMPDETSQHYGLVNIRRRCERHGFKISLENVKKKGTIIKIAVPVSTSFI